MFTYTTSGVCSKEITFEIDDDVIKSLRFYEGCSGSLQAISKLVEGMKVEEAIAKLKGVQCGNRATSCPDQLSKALERYLSEK